MIIVGLFIVATLGMLRVGSFLKRNDQRAEETLRSK